MTFYRRLDLAEGVETVFRSVLLFASTVAFSFRELCISLLALRDEDLSPEESSFIVPFTFG